MSNPQPDQSLPVDPERVRTNSSESADGPQYPYLDLRPEARAAVTPDDPGSLVGDDATATFDQRPSNPTERASSEALSDATRIDRSTSVVDPSDMKALNMEDADPDRDAA